MDTTRHVYSVKNPNWYDGRLVKPDKDFNKFYKKMVEIATHRIHKWKLTGAIEAEDLVNEAYIKCTNKGQEITEHNLCLRMQRGLWAARASRLARHRKQEIGKETERKCVQCKKIKTVSEFEIFFDKEANCSMIRKRCKICFLKRHAEQNRASYMKDNKKEITRLRQEKFRLKNPNYYKVSLMNEEKRNRINKRRNELRKLKKNLHWLGAMTPPAFEKHQEMSEGYEIPRSS